MAGKDGGDGINGDGSEWKIDRRVKGFCHRHTKGWCSLLLPTSTDVLVSCGISIFHGVSSADVIPDVRWRIGTTWRMYWRENHRHHGEWSTGLEFYYARWNKDDVHSRISVQWICAQIPLIVESLSCDLWLLCKRLLNTFSTWLYIDTYFGRLSIFVCLKVPPKKVSQGLYLKDK